MAIDVVAPAELDYVPHNEEVAGEPELAYDAELVVELRPRTRDAFGMTRAVARQGALPHQLRQPGLLGVFAGDREVRKPRCHESEIECTRAAE